MSDPRFARLKTDPRFRRPKKTHAKVVVDERFKDILDPGKKKKGKSGRVDKYGRPISDTHEQDSLKRFYRLDNEDEEEEAPKRPDFARGEVLLESSDEEDDEKKDNDSDSGSGEIITLGRDISKPTSLPNGEAEIDLNEDNFDDLDAQAAAYAKEHPEEQVEGGTRTHRLAVVNLDWDHVRASHLYKICASLVSPTAPLAAASSSKLPDPKRSRTSTTVARGRVLSVRVYPSEFGKERLAKEDEEGPPQEIFKKREDLDEEVNEKNIYEVGDEQDYNEDALRKYQLERLRYYYAIVICDTVDAASHIYNELEGTELERSANVFDLSFVPDDMTFDNEPRDEATEEVGTYKGVDFVTDALRHSKVKLTWDDDDPERLQVTRRNLTRKEIDDGDFKAYLASSSESESEAMDARSKKKNKKADRNKLRSLLLGGNDEDMPEGWGDDGGADDVDMEITFTPGLTDKKNEEDETTLERYQRKMKEKRSKRKEELKERGPKKGEKNEELEDDFFEAGSGEEDDTGKEKGGKHGKKGKVHQRVEEKGPRQESTIEELSLLVASDNPNAEPQHFNLKSVLKAEKKKSRKGKKGKKGKGDEEDLEVQENFTINVKDDRFKVLHEDHQFAIDPSNPHFKKTKSMTALLEERQKRQKELRGDTEEPIPSKGPTRTGERSLQSLVESVKRKSAHVEERGAGKRRKV